MKQFLLLSGLLLSVCCIIAQGVDSMIKVYADQVPDQKAYVHFDKDVYRAGETMWFKAYLFSGFSLSVNSKNFYAELVDDQGNIIQRKVYPVTTSGAAGNFDLPDSMPACNLMFRGYTTWMLNFDTSFIFQKDITITDNAGSTDKRKSGQIKNYSIQFFPEGGNLVDGLHSVVAFKANDERGMPVFAKGSVITSKGKVVAAFSSVHDGMGTFELMPAADEKYQAVWQDPSGKQQIISLPESKAQGVVLQLTASHGKKIFVISRTDNVPESWKKVYVIALLGQQQVFAAKGDLTGTTISSGLLPVQKLPSGILQVTVFSATWEPLAERITMINNENYQFDARINTHELNTNNRAKNAMEIQVDDTLLSSLSLSVTDAAAGRQAATDNIISHMLLTGDIKGYVHNAGYYFENNADSTAGNLDLVMLTHGWRRYNWANLATAKMPALKYPYDNYLSLDAKVAGVKTASPLKNNEQLLVVIQSKASSSHFLRMPKTGMDAFLLPDIIFYDTATVYYEFMKDKKAGQKMSVGFSTNLYKGVGRISLLDWPVNPQQDTTVMERTKYFAEKLYQSQSAFNRKGIMLAPVTVKSRIKTRAEQLDKKYTSGLFRGAEGYSFDLTNKEASSEVDIFSYLQGKVPGGLTVRRYQGRIELLWRGGTPALFLNEVLQQEATQLSGVPVHDIAYVKVLRPPFMGASMGGLYGAIAVYTKVGGEDEKQLPVKGLNKSTITGYSATKEFYNPDYANLSLPEQAAADNRTTLYWNPVIFTDATHKKVRLEFYNNNITKSFRIVLEGVNEIGKMVRVEQVIRQPE